jgi:hypothetical protein
VSLATELAAKLAADARLIVLQELARQIDGRLNELSIGRTLDVYGIRRDRDWVKTQLRKLEALGAVELQNVGTVLVAVITRDGRDHVEERALLEGVARPSEGGG